MEFLENALYYCFGIPRIGTKSSICNSLTNSMKKISNLCTTGFIFSDPFPIRLIPN